MSYRLERDEPVRHGLVRIARGQATRALRATAHTNPSHERLHDARTATKKLRAVLRLARSVMGKRYRVEDRRLRRIARTLSEIRDATVLLQTCDALLPHVEKTLRPLLRRARRHLVVRRAELQSTLDVARLRRNAAQAFREVDRRAKKWLSAEKKPARRGWSAIVPGLRRTYRRGRRALQTACDHGDASSFHVWRRAVKNHGYHIRLLVDMQPAALKLRQADLEQLGQLLGQEHDLAVLALRLRSDSGILGENVNLRLLERRIAQRQEMVRATARGLGRALYSESTTDLTRRLHTYWRVWRTSKLGPASAAPDPAAGSSPPPPRAPRVRAPTPRTS